MSKAKKINNQSDIMDKLLSKSDISLTNLVQGEIIEGTIVSITKGEVLVDIGAKSEGIISTQELSNYDKNLKIGDKILAKVLQTEDRQGYIVLSVKRAERERKWKDADEAFANGTIIDAKVIEYNKGGLLCSCLDLRGFIPLSHLDRAHFATDDGKFASGNENELKESLKILTDKTLKVKVIEIDKEKNRFVLSEKDALGTYTSEAKTQRLQKIQIGDSVDGLVTGIMPFGVFVDLNGVEGLVHISEIAWEKVGHPSDYFSVGQTVKVQVLGVDGETKKLALSVKRLTKNPWDEVEKRYTQGTKVTGVVSKIVPFGAFLNLEKGLDGLIHVSETDGPLSVGDSVTAIVTSVDGPNQKLALSVKKLNQDQVNETK